jgi:hypothetical protein
MTVAAPTDVSGPVSTGSPTAADHTVLPLSAFAGWALAFLSLGAAAIHFVMIAPHFNESSLFGLAFALMAWFQLAWALFVIRSLRRDVLLAGVIGNLAIIGTWAISRTVGLPVGPGSGVAEPAGFIDVLSVVLEAAVVLGAGALLLVPGLADRRVNRFLGVNVAGAVLVAVVAASTFAFSPSVVANDVHLAAGGADHHHGTEDGAATAGVAGEHSAEHGHAAAAAPVAVSQRCDLGFNTAAYYHDAALAGQSSDTATAMDDHGNDASGGPAHDDGERAAAQEIARISNLSDADYDAWLKGLAAAGHHDNPDTGMGGHVGPQAWVPMTDQAQCAQLGEELDQARAVAKQLPTTRDARAAGYIPVTPVYVPGIASHWIKPAFLADGFHVDQPEMLLYDGNQDESRLVGLSYYILDRSGEGEPKEGFTGDEDRYHRHIGLCLKGGQVIGDSTTTPEECAARGGVKGNGTAGYMSHAWVVEGCESPWGVFSAENPKLDVAVGRTSGDETPCGSTTRKYDDTPGPPANPPASSG